MNNTYDRPIDLSFKTQQQQQQKQNQQQLTALKSNDSCQASVSTTGSVLTANRLEINASTAFEIGRYKDDVHCDRKASPMHFHLASKSSTISTISSSTSSYNYHLDCNKMSINRMLTGKHVRHGTGAKVATLVRLRSHILDRSSISNYNHKQHNHEYYKRHIDSARLSSKPDVIFIPYELESL